jgi:flavin-dependent dehydrogenase
MVTLDGAAGRAWDVVVVGAGVAGPLAAHGLARRGAAVLLVDKATFPRWKVCGSCLNPRALAALAAAGLGGLPADCGAVPLPALRVGFRGRSAGLPLAGWVALSRERFDAALIDAAVRAGAAFLPGTTARLGPVEGDARLVRLRQGDREATASARLVLAADGLGGQTLAGAAVAAGSRVGAGVVAADGPEFYGPGTVFMAGSAAGYVGLVRLEDGRLNIAAAFDAAALKSAHAPGVAAERVLAEAGWPVPAGLAGLPWRGTPALTRAGRPAGERVLAVGDAAGYVEPFTGEGMAWALASALAVVPLALRAARGWRPELGEVWASRHRAAARGQRLCRAVAWLTRHPGLGWAALAALRRLPWAARWLTG